MCLKSLSKQKENVSYPWLQDTTKTHLPDRAASQRGPFGLCVPESNCCLFVTGPWAPSCPHLPLRSHFECLLWLILQSLENQGSPSPSKSRKQFSFTYRAELHQVGPKSHLLGVPEFIWSPGAWMVWWLLFIFRLTQSNNN